MVGKGLGTGRRIVKPSFITSASAKIMGLHEKRVDICVHYKYTVYIILFDKGKVSHSLTAVGALGVGVPLYLGHS